MYQISGKVALITGALGGIGKTYVTALLKENAKGIVLLDIAEFGSEDFLKQLEEQFGKDKAIYIKCDITDENELKRAFDAAIKKFNQLDIVINNAGIVNEIDMDASLKINLIAPMKCTYLAMFDYLPKYRKEGEESIILNTASIAGVMPFKISPIYGVTKHGVVSLGQSLANSGHYQRYKTRILTICPGMTNTPILMSTKITEELNQIGDDFVQYNMKLPPQNPENVANIMIEMIKEAENGAVWISHMDLPPVKYDHKKINKYAFDLIGFQENL